MIKGTHGPIEEAQKLRMRQLAKMVDDLFNPSLPGLPKPKKKVAFCLLTANFGDIKDGRVNYISNGDRRDMIAMLRELLDRFEGRHPEEGGPVQ